MSRKKKGQETSSVQANNRSIAAGAIAVSGGVDGGSKVVVAKNFIETVRITVYAGGWEFTGGKNHLSKHEPIPDEIMALCDGRAAIEKSTPATAVYSGPDLLVDLLLNYAESRRQWQMSSLSSEISLECGCFNQQDAKARIRADSSARVIELNGPSGIGKTHLLGALCRGDGLKPEDKLLWKHSHISAKGDFGSILAALVTGMQNSEQSSKIHPFSLDDLAKHLMCVYADGFRNILFMLDDTDSLDDDLLLRLVGDEGPVGETIRKSLPFAPGLKLRLVIASRRPRLTRAMLSAHGILGVHPIPMDILKIDDIQLMLREQVGKHIKMAVNESRIRELALEVFRITGGHPGAISLVVKELLSINFAVDFSKFTANFRPIVFQKVQNDIIGDLTVTEYLFLNVLSLCRFLTVQFVLQLIQKGLLPRNLLENQDLTAKNVHHWLDDLCETPALIKRDLQDTCLKYTVHPVLRHVLPMDLGINNPQILYRFHKEIFQIHDQDLRKPEQGGRRYQMSLVIRPIYTMQALYHAAQSQLIASQNNLDVEPIDLKSLASEYYKFYLESCSEEGPLDTWDPYTLQDQWEIDDDLHKLLQSLADRVDSSLYTQIKGIFSAT